MWFYIITDPSPPQILQVIERTNTTILLKIEPGHGSVEGFFILVNGTVHSQISLDSSKTSMTISSLQAGTVYNLLVKATSNNLTSAPSNAVINATCKLCLDYNCFFNFQLELVFDLLKPI